MVVPRFAGPDTFARLPRLDQVGTAAVAVVGVPFDAGVSYRSGARFGPAAIRAGSRLLRPYHPGLDVEPWRHHQVADAGDIACNPFDIGAAIASVEAGARELAARADRIMALGGDHTIALPLLRALHVRRGPMALVHFDAHLDTWDTYFGQPYTARDPVPTRVRGGAPRERSIGPRWHPRAALLHRGPRAGRRDGVRDHLDRRCRPAGRGRCDRPHPGPGR
jgi:agmatinase